MSSALVATAPPMRRRLRSWTSAAAATDDDSDESAAAATPATASVSSATSSDAAPPKRKRARRQRLLTAAFGDQPRPPRWRDLPPAQRCFSDGLSLTFSFLSLFDLIPAARTCRCWRDAAERASVPGVEVRNPLIWPQPRKPHGSSRLQSLISSPFRRHVHALTHSRAISPATTSARPAWGLVNLQLLQQLPQLCRISGMNIELFALRTELSTANAAQPLTFPTLLESTDLHLFSDLSQLDDGEEDWSTEPVQRVVLRALRPCHSLTELSIAMHPHSRFNVEPLQELANLQTLTLDLSKACSDIGGCTFDEEQIRAVAKLSSLRRLTLRECECWENFDEDDPFGTRWLRWLCSLPHRLHELQEIDLNRMWLHLEHMQLLERLPALTALEPACMGQSSIPMLEAFASRLQCLKLSFNWWDVEEEIDPEIVDLETRFARGSWLLPHLAPCAALTQLTLSSCVFDGAAATALCQALTQLQELDLIDVGWPSFESLRHLPLLESFSLQRSKTYPLHFDASHFEPLQRLRDLTLIGVHPLSEDAVAVIDALRPPSALLPALVDFCFSP